MAEIAIATRSPRLYHSLVRGLKELKIPFVSIRPGEPIPKGVRIVLAAKGEEVGDGRLIAVDEGEPRWLLLARILCLTRGQEAFNEVVIGVDPGSTIGVAVLADGVMVHSFTAQEIDGCLDSLELCIKGVSSKNYVIRVGGGAPLSGEVLDRVGRRFRGLDIEVVDEWGTSKRPLSFKAPRDIASAVNIALKRGRPLKLGGRRISLPSGHDGNIP